MCNTEQQTIEQNICELLQQIKGCCTSKEEIDNIKLQIDSIQLWMNSFQEGIPKTDTILLSSAVGDIEENTPLQEVLEYLYQLITDFESTGSVNLTVSNRNNNTLNITPLLGVGATIPSATTALSGLMTAADKTKLDGIVAGEVNTASNVGILGEGIFKQKTGVDLEFKKINAGSNKISISGDVSKIDIDVNTSNLTGIAQSQITNLVSDLALKAPLNSPSFTGVVTGITKAMVGLGSADNTPDLTKPISVPVNTALGLKQKNIQFQNEGVNLGANGVVDVINFTGASINATLNSNILTVDVTGGGGGGGATNLDYTPSATQGIVSSDTGTDAVITLATGTNAGLLSPSEFNKLTNISVTQSVDLDQLEADTAINNAKVSNATHTGDVTGSTTLTLATVNSNTGVFGSGTQIPQLTVNGKGLITGVSSVTITPSATSITGAGNITKTDDTNVTLTLGGTPLGSVLNSVSFTLGWTGTLSDSRISSSSNWNTAFVNRITSLTTTGNSGAATLVNNVLNIPVYTLSALGGVSLTALSATSPLNYDNTTGVFSIQNASTSQTGALSNTDWNTFNAKQNSLSGSGIVKSTAGVISYISDNSTGWDKSYQQNKIRVVSVNTTLSATTDGTVVFDTISTVATLPVSVNETVLVVKNNSGGSITVIGHIDGVSGSSYSLQSKESMKFHGNGITWYYIG